VIQAGERAPDFSAPDQTGTVVRLGDLLERGPVVLFFYPAALTPGCTKESCHFRDLAAEFGALGAQRVGISADEVEKQARFDAKYSFGYPLLSDPDRAIAKQFGVKRPIPLLGGKRATFVIGADGVVLGSIASEVNMDKHADEALDILRKAPR
jgi:thioredoxin-dependent peroxiredoxin